MNKKVKILISIIVIIILIAGLIIIDKILKNKSNNVSKFNIDNLSSINEEGQIYVIGQHLFTDATKYLSIENIRIAARTVKGLDVQNMEDEEILSSIIIYARDTQDNWKNAITGEEIIFADDFEFDIKYIDLVKVPDVDESNNIVKVETEEELKTAICNNIGVIDVKKDIEISSDISMKNREVIINLNGYKLKGSENVTEEALFNIIDSFVVLNGYGTIEGSGFYGGTILIQGSSLELNNVTVSGEYGLAITTGEEDELGISNSSVINAKNSIFNGKTCGIYFRGLGTVKLSDCTIQGKEESAVSVFKGESISNNRINSNKKLTITNNNNKLELTVNN